jgi:ribosomal protein S18 acetylase RimI-like enzyme
MDIQYYKRDISTLATSEYVDLVDILFEAFENDIENGRSMSQSIANLDWFIAKDKTRVVGCVACMTFGTIMICSMSVTATHRRRGIGKQLVHMLIEDHTIDFTHFIVEIHDDNEASLALFKSFGFKKTEPDGIEYVLVYKDLPVDLLQEIKSFNKA